MPDNPIFGQLAAARPDYVVGEDTPLRIAVWGDFSGRTSRGEARSPEELKSLRPRKVTFDELDDLISDLAPSLQLSTAGGEEIELEFSELDDFHPDPIYKHADVFNRLADSRDDKLTSPAAVQMRELLHLPAYQRLESAWRGLAWLLRRAARDRRVQVLLFDVTEAELRADLAASDDLAQSVFYYLLVTSSAAAPDGIPWGMVVGLYQFALTEGDAGLLGRMAILASHCGGPFLAAMHADVTRRESYELPPDLEAAWKALRALPEASYLALATPGFLLRPPFGDNYRPPESLPFEEFAGVPEGFLWGNPALACAALLAQGFLEGGWAMNPAVKRVLDSMPVHAYRDAHDDEVGVVTEARFTSQVGVALAGLGLIPVLSFKGRDIIELAAVRSLSQAQPLLAGMWTGGGKVTLAAPTSAPAVTVGLQAGPAPEGEVKSDDAEVDDDLAALLSAGDEDSSDDDDDSDSDDDDSDTSDEDSSSGDASDSDDIDVDAMLADLDAGDESTEEGRSEDETTDEAEDVDALLADVDPEDEEDGESPSQDKEAAEEDETVADEGTAGDDDLDALLAAGEDDDDGESESSNEDDARSGSGDSDLDALLAELGGDEDDEDDDSDESSDDEEATGGDEDEIDLDAMLADVGDDAETEHDSAADEALAESEDSDKMAEDTDVDIDAMLADLDQEGDDAADDESTSDTAAPAEGVDLVAAVRETQASTKYGQTPNLSPPVLDFLALVQPISDDEPAGGSVPFETRQKLDEMRREVNPEDFAADDPLRPDEPIRADWPGIVRMCQQTLAEKSKNLLIAARLVEALSRIHGFAGLRDGLHLFRQLVNVCWDRLEPVLEEDDDLEVRAAPFNWLDDPDRGACFPNTVRTLPIATAGGGRYGAIDWQKAREGREGLTADVLERAVFDAPVEQCRRVAADAQQALAELKQLAGDLRTKMGGEAPGLSFVRPVLEECCTLAKQIVDRRGAAEAPEEAAETTSTETGGAAVVTRTGPKVVTRDDLYRQLQEAAAALQRMEPHSPVPYIIQRAVAFGNLPFPQLMQELIRDSNVLNEMNRELGIKPPQSEY